MNIFTVITAIFITTLIGAIPLGLVNLSVMNSSYKYGKKQALLIANGASIIELIYVLTAIFASSYIYIFTQTYIWFQMLFILFPLGMGLIFLFKRTTSQKQKSNMESSLYKGIILNLLSIQVLMYWIMAIGYLKTYLYNINDLAYIPIILICVWLGKMFVLWLYAKFSNFIYSRISFLAANINKVIGLILITIGIIQYFKI